MGGLPYHEPPEPMSEAVRDLHRVLASVEEELEAIDWYRQRAEVTHDPSARDLLLHNMNEEVEHAVMGFEWLRRNVPRFDEMMRLYLFTSEPITEVEAAATGAGEDAGQAESPAPENPSLAIGSLRA